MADVFLYGPLCHPPLRAVVLGAPLVAEPAVVAGQAVVRAAGQSFAMIVPRDGGQAEGVVLRDLSGAARARLDFYLAVQGFDLGAVGAVQVPLSTGWSAADAWQQDAWDAQFAPAVLATAAEVMALFGQADPADVAARYEVMLVRGASRARAASPGPVTRRFAAGPDDLRRTDLRRPYAKFFAVEEHDLSWRQFDGSFSPVSGRAVFVSGDAVTVLPYDAARDRVLVVEQFRAGPMGRGDPQPWSIEAIAGRIDPGETPEDAARREAEEEAGLRLGAMLAVARYYPSPGQLTEYLYSFVALTDLPDGVAGVFGVEGEAENIRGHLMPFADLMALVASGEVENAPLILTALWLQRERARLRSGSDLSAKDPL